MDEFVQQHGMYEAQNNFYMQIVENAKVVLEHVARVVVKERNWLWKQWLATSKDFSCGPPAPVDHALSMCEAGSTEYSPTCLITCLPGYDDPTSKKSQLCQRVGKF